MEYKGITKRVIDPELISSNNIFNKDLSKIIASYSISNHNVKKTCIPTRKSIGFLIDVLKDENCSINFALSCNVQLLCDFYFAEQGKIEIIRDIYAKFFPYNHKDLWRYLYILNLPSIKMGDQTIIKVHEEDAKKDRRLFELAIRRNCSVEVLLRCWPSSRYVSGSEQSMGLLFLLHPEKWKELIDRNRLHPQPWHRSMSTRFEKRSIYSLLNKVLNVRSKFQDKREKLGLDIDGGCWVADIKTQDPFLHLLLDGHGANRWYHPSSAMNLFHQFGKRFCITEKELYFLDLIKVYSKDYSVTDAKEMLDRNFSFESFELFKTFFHCLVRKKKGGFVSLLKHAIKEQKFQIANYFFSIGYEPNIITITEHLKHIPEIIVDEENAKEFQVLYKNMLVYYIKAHEHLLSEDCKLKRHTSLEENKTKKKRKLLVHE